MAKDFEETIKEIEDWDPYSSEEENEDTNEGSKEQESPESSKLEELESKSKSNETLTMLMADPNIRAVLDAKQRGEKIKIVAESEDPQEEEEEEINWDEEDPDPKKLADFVLSKVNKTVSSQVAQAIEQAVKPLKDQLNGVSSHVSASEKEKLSQQIAQVKQKYPDFDGYVTDMVEINKATPGHSVEELYILAKARKNGGVKAFQPDRTETERPTSSASRVSGRGSRGKVPSGKAGFSEILERGLSS